MLFSKTKGAGTPFRRDVVVKALHNRALFLEKKVQERRSGAFRQKKALFFEEHGSIRNKLKVKSFRICSSRVVMPKRHRLNPTKLNCNIPRLQKFCGGF